MKRVIITAFLICFSSGMAADFGALAAQRRANEAELVEAGKRLEQLNLHADPSALVVATIREADAWTDRNVEYRAELLKNAYARFNTPSVSKQISGTNIFFLTALILAEVPKLPADRAMLTMNGLWNTMTVPAPDESAGNWEARRKQNMELWFATAEAAASQFKPELANSLLQNSVAPPADSVLKDSGENPAFEPNPAIRAKYYEAIYQNDRANSEINKARAINENLPKFEKRAESLATMLYSKPPYALDELQEILDRRVSYERGSNIMNAVYRALPKAVAATIPRPVPNAAKTKSGSQGTVAPSRSDLPAVARPSKVLEGARQQQAAQSAQVAGAAKLAPTESPAGMVAATGAVPAWAWAALGLVALAGGSVWVRTRG